MTAKELARKSADEILKTLGRDEKTLRGMLENPIRGGWRFSEDEIKKELLLAGVVRALKEPESPKSMNPEDMSKEIDTLMSRLFLLRIELGKKTGDVPAGRIVDFEKYITK